MAALIFLLPSVSDSENFKCLIFVAHTLDNGHSFTLVLNTFI